MSDTSSDESQQTGVMKMSEEQLIATYFSGNSSQKYGDSDRFAHGPWLFIDKAGNAYLTHSKPERINDNEWNMSELRDLVMVPQWLVAAINVRALSFGDDPILLADLQSVI